jgi:hypothetical protein
MRGDFQVHHPADNEDCDTEKYAEEQPQKSKA